MNPKHKKYKENNMNFINKLIKSVTQIFLHIWEFFLILRNKAITDSKEA